MIKSKVSAGNYESSEVTSLEKYQASASKHNNSHSLVAGVNANMYFEITRGTRLMMSLGVMGRGMFGKNEYSVHNKKTSTVGTADTIVEEQFNNGKLSFREFGSVYFGLGISQDIYKDLTIEAMVTNGISISKLKYTESNAIYTRGSGEKMVEKSNYERSNSKVGVSYRLGARVNLVYKDKYVAFVDYAMDSYKINKIVNDPSMGTALNVSASYFKNRMVNNTVSVGLGIRFN